MIKLRFFLFSLAALAAVFFLALVMEPEVEKRAYENVELRLSETDSLLVDGCWEGRQAGYVNLEKFVELAEKSSYFDSYKKNGRDSITFHAKSARIFFGQDSHLLRYENLCIGVGADEKSFTAAVEEIDGVKYIYIPYHVLASLAAVAY